MQTTRLRAIITVRIMAPHPQTTKITPIAAHPLLLQQLPLKILPHPLQKKFAKVLLDNYMIVKVKRQKVWLSARGNLKMIYCPTLQRLKVRPWARFSEAPLRLRCRVNLKHGVRKRKPRRTPNEYEVLVIWVRRLSESSFSSVSTSSLTLITKLQSHSAVSSGFEV